MKTSKIAFATASALLLTTAFSSAQTTIGGNMRVGYKATSSDLGAGVGSNRGFTKETQINVANKGKLNIGGLEYAAGFSIELDGSDLNTTTTTTSSKNNTANTIIPMMNIEGDEKKLQAAATLQALTRGMIARKSFNSIRKHTTASIIIQKTLVKWWIQKNNLNNNQISSVNNRSYRDHHDDYHDNHHGV